MYYLIDGRPTLEGQWLKHRWIQVGRDRVQLVCHIISGRHVHTGSYETQMGSTLDILKDGHPHWYLDCTRRERL